jgi:hypothetical protein
LSANTSVTSGQKFFEAAQGSAATAKSTAQFTVEGGTLQLIAVPDLNFGQIPLQRSLAAVIRRWKTTW